MKRNGQNLKRKAVFLAGITGIFALIQPVYAETKSVDKSEQQTVITANVPHQVITPSYVMSIPSAVNFGNLNSEKDQIQNYEIEIDVKDKTGTLTVSAPESGTLSYGTNTLKFENDFGNQKLVLADLKADEKIKKNLSGTLTIRGKEIQKAVAGNYTGTTTFTITYTDKSNSNDDKNHGNGGNGGNNNGGNGNQNAASGIKNTLKNNTLGKNTLGTGTLGKSSLGSGLSTAGKTASSLKKAGIKTGDMQNYAFWLSAMVISGICLLTVVLRKKK